MKTLTESELSQFTGTEHYYRNQWGLVYTDGVKHVAERAGAYWLLDLISSYQPMLARRKDARLQELQFWKLVVNEDHSAVVTCVADSDEEPVVRQVMEFTDFPLPELDVWVANDVLGKVAYLKSEH
jgi:hypothetical protein